MTEYLFHVCRNELPLLLHLNASHERSISAAMRLSFSINFLHQHTRQVCKYQTVNSIQVQYIQVQYIQVQYYVTHLLALFLTSREICQFYQTLTIADFLCIV